MATSTDAVPEDDEAWLYGEPEKKEEKSESEAVTSTLSADAPPFEPAAAAETENASDDKEAGEVSGEDNLDDDSDDDDDVQVTIGDIKTQPATYEKFKSGYTRSAQANKQVIKGVDLETPGTFNDQSIYDYDLTTLNVDDRAWRKPGADITDYFNYGFTEETWMKYCEKQKYLRNENGVNSKMFIHTLPPAPRRDISTSKPPMDPPVQSQSYRPSSSTTTTTVSTVTTTDAAAALRMAGPPPGRKMSGTIDVIGGTRNDSRRPQSKYDYENQSPNDSTDYTKKWPPTDLPPPHIPPPGYGPPPPITVPPPGAVPPPHMTAPPMGVPPPNVTARFQPGAPPPSFRDGFYPPPTGPPPPDRPPPGYDGRTAYGYDAYSAPPPGYGAPPPAQPGWDRGTAPYNEWDYRRDRSPARSESDYSSSGEEYGDRRYRSRDMYDPFERQGRPRSRERREMERGDRDDRSRDRERRHRERSERDRDRDRDKDDRHRSRSSRKEGSDSAEHRSSKHKKSKRSKRERDEESVDTGTAASTTGSP